MKIAITIKMSGWWIEYSGYDASPNAFSRGRMALLDLDLIANATRTGKPISVSIFQAQWIGNRIIIGKAATIRVELIVGI